MLCVLYPYIFTPKNTWLKLDRYNICDNLYNFMTFKDTERRESQYIFIICNIFSYLQFLVLICSHGFKLPFSVISLFQNNSVPIRIFCPSINYFTVLQPTRLIHPWDFPGKSTGVGCHCLHQIM